jgi:hypothetical protein
MSMQDWYNFVTEVGILFKAYVPIVERKKKDLPIRLNKEPGKKSEEVVMLSSIWFTTKALYLA